MNNNKNASIAYVSVKHMNTHCVEYHTLLRTGNSITKITLHSEITIYSHLITFVFLYNFNNKNIDLVTYFVVNL